MSFTRFTDAVGLGEELACRASRWLRGPQGSALLLPGPPAPAKARLGGPHGALLR